MLRRQQDHVRGLLADAVKILCKSSITYQKKFKIEGLLGITIDDNEVLLVNIREDVNHVSIPKTLSSPSPKKVVTQPAQDLKEQTIKSSTKEDTTNEQPELELVTLDGNDSDEVETTGIRVSNVRSTSTESDGGSDLGHHTESHSESQVNAKSTIAPSVKVEEDLADCDIIDVHLPQSHPADVESDNQNTCTSNLTFKPNSFPSLDISMDSTENDSVLPIHLPDDFLNDVEKEYNKKQALTGEVSSGNLSSTVNDGGDDDLVVVNVENGDRSSRLEAASSDMFFSSLEKSGNYDLKLVDMYTGPAPEIFGSDDQMHYSGVTTGWKQPQISHSDLKRPIGFSMSNTPSPKKPRSLGSPANVSPAKITSNPALRGVSSLGRPRGMVSIGKLTTGSDSAGGAGTSWGSSSAPVGRGHCTVCNKEFTHLRRHVNSVHTRESSITCEICLKQFYRKDHWKVHMKNIHNC